jgi:hypothetical protein
MGSGQHLDGLHLLAVAGDETVVVAAVGAHHVRQHLGVAGVGLGAAGRVPLAVPRCRHRVDRVELVAGRNQRGDEQTSVGLDADRLFGGVPDMRADQLMEPGDDQTRSVRCSLQMSAQDRS